ncbi:transglutaminase-like cysteine peptidase [Wenzhouxiangella limi]|uniref:Transglutaminase n=1 Tax=Wenzhouxiangella limi TaxID=2707351 RepID=A0A845UYY0_9GAMM|nr:transglutaminase-like cysteine peptidase [Wenzhouxiangella limi]NDY95482.1 transglutaminase [Wenzhouxiangella limi]
MRLTLIRSLLTAGIVITAACSSTLLRPQPDTSLQIDFEQLSEQMRDQFSDQRVEVIERWAGLLEEIRSEPAENQLDRVNEFFHRNVRYQIDQQLYGEEDYWASPLETLGHGRGDCEDWAIAKYISLRHLGIPDRNLRLIYVRAQIGGPRSPVSQAHMVLGYYSVPNAEPIILDSLISNVLPASERTDLSPVFSFNADGLWVGQGSAPAAGSPTARLSLWREVIAQMQREGIRIQ